MTGNGGAGRADLHEQWQHGTEVIAPLDLAAMLRVVWYGKWLILCVTALLVFLAGIYAFRIAAPQYAATATLQMDLGRGMTSENLSPEREQETFNTTIALATSDPVLERVIIELDLLSDPEFNRYLFPARPFALRTLRTKLRHVLAGTTEQAPDEIGVHDKTIDNLRRVLTAERQADTHFLRITAQSGDEAKAATLANVTASALLQHNDALQQQAQSEAAAWFETRVVELRAQLEDQELQAAALIATAQLQEDGGIDTLAAEVLSADQALIAAHSKLALVENTPEPISARSAAEIIQIRNEINEIAAHKERMSTQLSAQSAGLAQLHHIQLQIDATRQIYQTILHQLHENRMQQELSRQNAQQLTPATSTVYVGPRKILLLTIAAMLGGTLGVMLVALRHCTRKGAVDARSLREATGLPVLAQLSARALRPLRTGQRALPLRPGSNLMHAAQGLQTALAVATRGQSAQVILSTSSTRGEGKTLLAVLLAHALSASNKRVAFIAADGRNALVGKLIGHAALGMGQERWQGTAGTSDATALGADVYALPAQDAPGTLLAETFSERLAELRQRYDYIIIDGPPVLHAPEAQLFASQSDAIVYSVRWARTPISVVNRGLDTLAAIDCHATGLVLSKINPRKMKRFSSDPCISTIQRGQVI